MEKMTYTKYGKRHSDGVFIEDKHYEGLNDWFDEEFETWMDENEFETEDIAFENLPEIYGAESEAIELDLGTIINSLLESESSFSDYTEVTNKDKIKNFVEEFNEKWADYSYWASNVMIHLSDAEIREWKAYVRAYVNI